MSVRDITARESAMRVYAEAYDRLATQAQVLASEGKPVTAAIVRHRASIALGAWRAERRPEHRADPFNLTTEDGGHNDR